jgi:mono/diheme cytochrome c family protein
LSGGRVLCATAGALAGFALAASAQQTTTSAWDGVYTDAQSVRGSAVYIERCALCHGAALGGVGEAPALTGVHFVSDFNGLTLGDLFDRIRMTMPLNNPAALSRAQYADVLAFLLKSNGFPSGANELYRRSEYLSTIAFEAQRRRQ